MKNKTMGLLLITIFALSVLAPASADKLAVKEQAKNQNQIKNMNQEQNKTAIKTQKAEEKLAEKIAAKIKTKTQLKQMDKVQLKDGSGAEKNKNMVKTQTRAGNYQGRSTK